MYERQASSTASRIAQPAGQIISPPLSSPWGAPQSCGYYYEEHEVRRSRTTVKTSRAPTTTIW
jgi:hypothetical protein